MLLSQSTDGLFRYGGGSVTVVVPLRVDAR